MRRSLVVCLLVLLLGSWSAQAAWARPLAQATVSMSLQPTVLTLEYGQEFELLVVIESGATPVDGAQVTLGFDPDHVRVLEIIARNDLSDLLPAPSNLPDRFSNSEGRISYAAGKLFGTPPSGAIEVFLVRFQAVDITPGTEIEFVEDDRFFSNKVTSSGQILGLSLLGCAVAIEGNTPTPTSTGAATATPTATRTETPVPPPTDDSEAYPGITEEPSFTPSPTPTPTLTPTWTPSPSATLAPRIPTNTPLPRRDETATPTNAAVPTQPATAAPRTGEPPAAPTETSTPPQTATLPSTAPQTAVPPPSTTPSEGAAAPTGAPPPSDTPPAAPEALGAPNAAALEPESAAAPEEQASLGAFVKKNIGSLVAILVIAISALGFALVRRQMSAE